MKKQHLTVSALNKYLKSKFDRDKHLQNISLTGEISNFTHARSGHMYFTLKDDKTKIRAAMFLGSNRHLKFIPENGMKVLITGSVTVYVNEGNYQLIVNQMEPDGIGSLYLAYEQLKEKLTKQNIFNEDNKQLIPQFPKHIGVITSPTGAAIRDIITTLKRRYPVVQITVIPAFVQGKEAAASLEQAIVKANELMSFDTIIIGRGGGSIEDLWSFNEENVVRAIYHSSIPVISAIGHETDFTLSDFASDLRAATPTAAAELAVPSLLDINNKLTFLNEQLTDKIHLIYERYTKSVQRLTASYAFKIPEQLILNQAQYVDRLNDKAKESIIQLKQKKSDKYKKLVHQLSMIHPQNKLTNYRSDLATLQTKLQSSLDHELQIKAQKLEVLMEKLILLNPLHIIKRGFSVTYQENGDILKSVHHVSVDETLEVQLIDGIVNTQITDIREEITYDTK